MSDKDVNDIVSTACEKNKANGVTGVLVSKGPYFVQYIEGPQSAIKKTYELIKLDYRHDNVVLMELGISRDRVFDGWHLEAGSSAIRNALEKASRTYRDHETALKILAAFM